MDDDSIIDVVEILDDAPNTSQAGPGRKRNIANVARGLELRSKYRCLEKDLNKVKSERDFFKKRVVTLEPALALSQVHSHDIDIDGDEEDWKEYRSKPFGIDNVEIEVCIKGRDYRVGSGTGPSLTFAPHITLSGEDGPRYVLVMVTVSQRSRNRMQSVQSTSTFNSLLDKPMTTMTTMGPTETLKLTDDLSNSQLSIHITAVVQKEFKVNAAYLSQWSRYFRAYFAVDMEEKKTGRYPIKDDDITADNFQELLNVIYPMQKPISNENFELLLKMANRFEMPDLVRRIELFLMDFSAHEMDRARVFRLATDKYCLSLIQATLLDRWRDSTRLRRELLTHHIYHKLQPATRNMINQHFVDGSTYFTGQTVRRYAPSDDDYFDDDDLREAMNRLEDQEYAHRGYLTNDKDSPNNIVV
ncbi:hypothetical protein PRIPAC_73753 [Pristionchus pacificus]|uniref:BTB domain-containing protein n=1 Tax=Pristionchus pacificus TaxID=54126 RepID=A0A2A6C1F6_PRIPA|nr:hypothetical protein PRIPAC_73753 [Pristionchus pacificus]|eukprot:PDM71970.1 BTB domain-containing protein [Pristionchus pacificus]